MPRIPCLLAIVLLTLSAASLHAVETVKVGVNIGLSGRGEDTDTHELQTTLIMREKQLNARPNAPYHYKLIFEDNNYTPVGAVMAARKLLSWDKVDAFITIYDFAMAPVAPIARQNKVANVGFAWGVRQADGECNFVFGYSEIAAARAMYAGLKKSPEMPTTIVGCLQASIPGFAEEMQRLAKADGRKPFEVVFFNPGEIEFRTMILKIRETGAQRLILLAWGGELNKLMYQLSQQPDYKPELWGFSFGFLYAEARPRLTGSVVVGRAPIPAAFDKMFEAYAKTKPKENCSYIYDSLNLIVESLESTPPGNLTLRERILQGLREKKSFMGITGTYTQTKGVFDVPAMLFRLTPTGEEPFMP